MKGSNIIHENRYVNKVARSYCVTLAPEHTIWCAWNPNLKILQKVDGPAHTAKLKETTIKTTMMNIKNFAGIKMLLQSCILYNSRNILDIFN